MPQLAFVAVGADFDLRGLCFFLFIPGDEPEDFFG